MHKIIFFSRKKVIKKICVPTLPKIFRPVSRNTLFFYLAYTQEVVDAYLGGGSVGCDKRLIFFTRKLS